MTWVVLLSGVRRLLCRANDDGDAGVDEEAEAAARLQDLDYRCC